MVVPTRINSGRTPVRRATVGAIRFYLAVLHTLYQPCVFQHGHKASSQTPNGYILLPDLVQDMIDALVSNVGN
jgi:hypothetical protein